MPTESKALLVLVHAKPGKEAEVAEFLAGALALAQQEPDTLRWYALRLSDNTFGVFDTFAGDAGRQAHLDGPIAAALMENAEALLSEPPRIEHIDLLAVK